MGAPRGQRPVSTAAAATAQAPVPQASVAPLPRSHTVTASPVGLMGWANSTLMPPGNAGWCPSARPQAASSAPVGGGSCVKSTQCGLPTATQCTLHARPPAQSGTSSSGPPPSPTAPTASGAAVKRPSPTCHNPSPTRCSTRCPAEGVSIRIQSRRTPWVYKNSAAQRTPLPHMTPSLPSALNIRMTASPSARSGGQR